MRLIYGGAAVVGLALLTLWSPAAVATPIADPAGLPSPVTDEQYYDQGARESERVELGRLLFFDKILSGNGNIACATCHHPTLGTSDGVALGFGEGPDGLGRKRSLGRSEATAVHGRLPRNSPALFNLGAAEFTRLFHDGRVETDTNGYYESGFVTPAKWKLPSGLENALAAQAMFPVTSPDEMAGQKGENPVAEARSLNNAAGPGGVWAQLADRLRVVPEYVDLFRSAFPDDVRGAEDITFVHAANAIAAFETVAFRADDSRFDRYLRGESDALSVSERRGMAIFYGEAGCSSCHSGPFQTDHDFHAIAMPQIGPGKGDGNHSAYWSDSGERAFLEDFGRGRVTVLADDNFKFRTPSLRNVELTGPWGHAGAYTSLESVVRHHLDPTNALARFDAERVELPRIGRLLETGVSGSRLSQRWLAPERLEGVLMRDTYVQRNAELQGRIAAANELAPVPLTDTEVADLVSFLKALTDPSSRRLSEWVPKRVPSGLRVDR